MNTSANDLMSKLFDGMEASVGFSAVGVSPAQRFRSLNDLAKKNRKMADECYEYARFLAEIVKSRAKVSDQEGDYKELVVYTIFASIVRGMTFKVNSVVPKVHHWLPVTYLKGFSGGSRSGSKTGHVKNRALIPSVVFSNGHGVRVTVRDIEFAHPVNADLSGYYDLGLEYFFSHMEGLFAISKGEVRSVDFVNLASFFIVQTVRNPHPSVGFYDGKIEVILDALIKNIDYFDRIYAKAGKTDLNMPFTPYIPTRVREDSQGVQSMCLPTGSRHAVVISNGPVSERSYSQTVNSYRSFVINSAIKSGGVVFGIEPNSI